MRENDPEYPGLFFLFATWAAQQVKLQHAKE